MKNYLLTKHDITELWDEKTEEHLFHLFWRTHVKWLASNGWSAATRREYPDMPIRGSQHRTVDRLRRFIQTSGLVNAHFGLTSSDVEDNVRLAIINRVIDLVKLAVESVYPVLDCYAEDECEVYPAFTHWQPAGVVSPKTKRESALAPLRVLLTNAPVMRGKMLGGPCGDAWETKLLFKQLEASGLLLSAVFPWEEMNLLGPNNDWPIQSSDHISETNFVYWISLIAAQIHKIATDLRFTISHGILTENHEGGYRGSSSIPQKSNPYLLEKVCSIMRSLSTGPFEVWQVLAHNGCERTLDTSWQLRHLMVRLSKDLMYGLTTLADVRLSLDPSQKSAYIRQQADAAQFLREDLALRVIQGQESRLSAYEALHADQDNNRIS